MTAATSPMARIEALPTINADNADKHGFSIAYGGESGTGKTTNALSYPEPIRGIYADVNKATVIGEINKGRDIVLTTLTAWREYEDLFVPAVENRLFDCATIVVDTLDFLSNMMWESIQGGREKLTIPMFGVGLNKLLRTTERMIRSTQYIPGKPTYNVVFTYHISETTGEDGALQKVTPAVMGKAKDIISSCFDTCLLCDVRQVSTTSKDDTGKTITEYRKEFFVHTAPPTRFHKSLCKTGPEFPVRCGGKYDDIVGYLRKGS